MNTLTIEQVMEISGELDQLIINKFDLDFDFDTTDTTFGTTINSINFDNYVEDFENINDLQIAKSILGNHSYEFQKDIENYRDR